MYVYIKRIILDIYKDLHQRLFIDISVEDILHK